MARTRFVPRNRPRNKALPSRDGPPRQPPSHLRALTPTTYLRPRPPRLLGSTLVCGQCMGPPPPRRSPPKSQPPPPRRAPQSPTPVGPSHRPRPKPKVATMQKSPQRTPPKTQSMGPPPPPVVVPSSRRRLFFGDVGPDPQKPPIIILQESPQGTSPQNQPADPPPPPPPPPMGPSNLSRRRLFAGDVGPERQNPPQTQILHRSPQRVPRAGDVGPQPVPRQLPAVPATKTTYLRPLRPGSVGPALTDRQLLGPPPPRLVGGVPPPRNVPGPRVMPEPPHQPPVGPGIIASMVPPRHLAFEPPLLSVVGLEVPHFPELSWLGHLPKYDSVGQLGKTPGQQPVGPTGLGSAERLCAIEKLRREFEAAKSPAWPGPVNQATRGPVGALTVPGWDFSDDSDDDGAEDGGSDDSCPSPPQPFEYI